MSLSMESRKRPLADVEDTAVSKKRILTGSNGSPKVNGDSEPQDEVFGEKLELFRKEAIYRRMKHYSKEHERSQARIEELELRKSTCEAGLAAISACWAQLVDTIRLIVKPDDFPRVSLNSQEIFNLTAHLQNEPSSEVATALGDTVNATQALVTKFVQLEDSERSRVLQNDKFPEWQKAQNECIVLRSELNIFRERLKDSNAQKEKYHNSLIALENQIERLKSATVQATESRHADHDLKTQEVKAEVKDEAQDKPSSPAFTSPTPTLPIHSNGTYDSSMINDLMEQLKHRDAKILELEREAALLRDEHTMMELEHKSPTLEQISDNPHYKVLLAHTSHLESLCNEKVEQVLKLQEEMGAMQANRNDWEEFVTNSAMQAAQECKAILAKRDAENVRLREQREQLSAELTERRQKDSVKLASYQEFKSLIDSNSERITVLQSELRRCKAQLAANAGAEDLMLFFLQGDVEEAKYFGSLKEQKAQAEGRVAALEQTFSIYQDDHPDIVQHMKAQADALEALSRAKSELSKYQSVFGSLTDASPDIVQLKGQLESKETELQHLRLLEAQNKANTTAMESELEKLCNLWESLERQLEKKVFDLSALEERLAKSGIDKAKSDNKYYAAMRDKEAIDNERKILTRTLEKQGKVADRLTEVGEHLKSQITALEKENTAYKKILENTRDKLVITENKVPDLQASLECERMRSHDLQVAVRERDKQIQMKKAEFRAKEEELLGGMKDLEKEVTQLKKKWKAETHHSKSDPEYGKLASLEALIHCSTCREDNAFRSTIITKCMHTFCKACVDARLATRQRKCPACNLAFGQSDVHTFFFQ